MVCDDGLDVVFEILVSTDKQDSVASQESNAIIDPLISQDIEIDQESVSISVNRYFLGNRYWYRYVIQMQNRYRYSEIIEKSVRIGVSKNR